MWRELAEAQEQRSSTHLSDWQQLSPSLQWLDATEDTAQLLLLDALRATFSAAQLWQRQGAGGKAARCVAQAALIRLQLQVNQTVVGLSPAAASVVLQQQADFHNALAIASAYELTTPADWSLLLWRKLETPPNKALHAFLYDWAHTLKLPQELLIDVAERVQKELQSRRMDHSSGVVRVFCHLLSLLPNIEERLMLASLSRCSVAEVEQCNAILDRVPPDSGPLLLRRGHGGGYMPMI